MTDELIISDLISKKLTGNISLEEDRRLQQWLEDPQHRALFERLQQKKDLGKSFCKYVDIDSQKNFRDTLNRAATKPRKRSFRYTLAAAVLAPVLFVSGYLVLQAHNDGNRNSVITHSSTQAQLILASGKVVNLATEQAPDHLDEANAVIDSRGDEHVLSYRHSAKDDASEKGSTVTPIPEPELHTLVVPRGVNYNVELSDGTLVYLDADSRLEYPSRFVGDSRIVSVSGRAYFEVAHDTQHPFIVRTSRADIRVFGTEFCVSDNGSQTTTTLIQGSVGIFKLQSDIELARLTPGSQAVVSGDRCEVQEVEPLYATAWKDGYFIFNACNIDQIMEELSSWYNIDYVLEDQDVSTRITARIRRYDNIDSVLDILAKTRGVNFRQDGRVITVTK